MSRMMDPAQASVRSPVVVVGAGIMGLSCAIELLESGQFYPVTIVADSFSPHTTSDGAGALWRPAFLQGTPEHLALRWANHTYYHLLQIMQEQPTFLNQRMLHLCEGDELFCQPQEEPYWKDTVSGFRHTSARELNGFNSKCATNTQPFVDGFHFSSVLINSSVYLAYLTEKFRRAGGVFERQTISEFKHLALAYAWRGTHALVVNCTGLGARNLCRDESVVPARGQTVKVKAPAVDRFLVILEGPYAVSYILPRDPHGEKGQVVLGGTHEQGDWEVQSNAPQTERILDFCSRFVPALKAEEVQRSAEPWAGLRPERQSSEDGVRLSVDESGVIHNYGHGGSGLTLHWGCAKDVLELALRVTKTRAKL